MKNIINILIIVTIIKKKIKNSYYRKYVKSIINNEEK